MCFAAYRRDLARLFRPFRDHACPVDWQSVCDYLGLAGEGTKVADDGRWLLPQLLLICSSAVISRLQWFIPLPPAWFYMIAVQIAAALPIFIFIRLYWAGPFPFKPYRDVLPYPRLGTRVRHLGYGKKKESTRKGDNTSLIGRSENIPGGAS
jgi:hypothetical protein